jgi:hypothetical protein
MRMKFGLQIFPIMSPLYINTKQNITNFLKTGPIVKTMDLTDPLFGMFKYCMKGKVVPVLKLLSNMS